MCRCVVSGDAPRSVEPCSVTVSLVWCCENLISALTTREGNAVVKDFMPRCSRNLRNRVLGSLCVPAAQRKDIALSLQRVTLSV